MAAITSSGAQKPAKVLIYRHSVVTRATHWINVVAISFLLLSGLQIFNAHPALYWGQKSTFANPWVWIDATERKDGSYQGFTKIGSARFDTTGVLGFSGKPGAEEVRGFPAWATIPTYRDLASGRRWHFFFAWLFVINGLTYLGTSFLSRHIQRDLWPTKADVQPRRLLHEIVTHAQLKFPKGEDARRYNVLQKGAYLAVVLILLPAMVLTGLSMSPGFDAIAPFLLDVFGGRQSARTIHFLSASLIVIFIVVHLLMVLVSGVWNNLRSMITGRYAIEVEGDRP
jgi:thiosulfate reductase cytochrome b subunit